jgi:glycogen synthase
MRWAIDTYRFRAAAFRKMQHRAMLKDFSWTTSARQYIAMYERALTKAAQSEKPKPRKLRKAAKSTKRRKDA